MKIGPIDVSVSVLIYIGGFVAAIVVLVALWRANSEIRYEAWHRDTILRAMNNQDADKGIEACQALIARYPDKVSARLFLGNLLYQQKQFEQAEKEFSEAAAKATTPEQKAWALVGRGVAAYMAAAKGDQAKALGRAEAAFEEAFTADKNCTDALVDLAVAQLRAGDSAALDKVEDHCKQALSAATPPALSAQAQLYIALGLVAMRSGRPLEATANFERAKGILPTWKDADAFRRISMLAAATQKDVEPAQRREMLATCETGLSKFGKEQVTALNALGIGWWLMKGAPESYASALTRFQKAMDTDSKDPRAYRNAAGLREDRIAEWAVKLSGPWLTETPRPNKWLLPEKALPLRFVLADRQPLQELSKLLKDTEGVWQKFVDKAAPKPEEKVEAKLWQVSCIRRQAYLLEVTEESQRAALLAKALSLMKDLVALAPENPVVHYTLGMVLYEKEDYTGAYGALKTAEAKGMKTPALQRLLGFLGSKSEILDVRPSKDRRSFGRRPLVGGTLKAPGAPKRVTMKLGDKVVDPVMVGTQVLFVPAGTDLPDGDVTVSISFTDTFERTTECAPFTFSLDLKPPSWSVAPDASAPIPPKTVFTITLADRSGIDYGTTKLTLKEVSAKKAGRNIPLISDGRYKTAMPDIDPPRRIGHPLDSESFKVSAGAQELTPGDWELSISVQDQAGNQLSDTKRYTVK